MNGSVRLLLAEDNPADVELELRELKRAGLPIEHRLAIDAERFVRILREFSPDIILSDFSMPAFDGMEALRVARETAPDTPFIFVSGTLGEDYAIRAMKNGATDYVLKTNLVRLPAAVERALLGADDRRARRLAESGLRRAQLMAKLAHVVTAEDGRFDSWSESLAALAGVEADFVPRTTREWLDLLHPDDRETFRQASIKAGATGKRVDVEYRMRRDDGIWIHVRQVIEPLETRKDSGHGDRWFSTLQDISDQKNAQDAIQRLNRVHAVLSSINGLIVRATSRDQLLRDACEVAVEHGKFPMAWIGLVDKTKMCVELIASAGHDAKYLAKMPMTVGESAPGLAALVIRESVARISNDIETDTNFLIRGEALAGGYHSLVMLPLVVAKETVGLVVLYAEQARFFDEAEMKLLNELAENISFAVDHLVQAKKLEYLAYHDSLTGLANRALLMDRLGQFMSASQEGRVLALAILDIERFKTINDTLGRAAGDSLLTKMAERLLDLAGDASRLSRTGPDQFAVLIPNAKALQSVAHAIEKGFERVEGVPFNVAGNELRVAIRSGISVAPADGRDADTLFRNAEAALKKAKRTGEKYLFYTQEMTERVAERLSLENKLRQAVEKEEFVLHYQPKVDLEGRNIVGLEALIRWQSPQGLIPPLQFIPILEETGLISQVGAWALRRAALDHRAWVERGKKAPRIAVNVSAIQLRQQNFVTMVKQAIEDGVSPTAIDVEITESLVMEDIAGNIEKLKAIRELGIEIAVDDFGTGHSSLAYLAKLPGQALKIDRSFIIAMDKDANAMTLVSTIISLAHSLRLKVVAEGVETEDQANTLRLLHCDIMQGYLISRPLPMESISALF